jgi:hypothetical protein
MPDYIDRFLVFNMEQHSKETLSNVHQPCKLESLDHL